MIALTSREPPLPQTCPASCTFPPLGPYPYHFTAGPMASVCRRLTPWMLRRALIGRHPSCSYVQVPMIATAAASSFRLLPEMRASHPLFVGFMHASAPAFSVQSGPGKVEDNKEDTSDQSGKESAEPVAGDQEPAEEEIWAKRAETTWESFEPSQARAAQTGAMHTRTLMSASPNTKGTRGYHVLQVKHLSPNVVINISFGSTNKIYRKF